MFQFTGGERKEESLKFTLQITKCYLSNLIATMSPHILIIKMTLQRNPTNSNSFLIFKCTNESF